MLVVGANGSWYLLSKRRGQPTVSAAEGVALWRIRYSEIAVTHDPLIEQRILSDAQALAREVHETMVRLAPEIGLRFDHLKRWR